MEIEMLEKEIRKVFSMRVEYFDLSESTRMIKNAAEEILVYDYKAPIRVDNFFDEIEMLRKRILNKYVDNLSNKLEEMLYEIRMISASSVPDKENLIRQQLEQDFRYDASMQIEDFMDDYLRPFRRLSEHREFEDLYGDLRRNFIRYIEDVNDEIYQNNRQLSKAMENIEFDFKPVELEKSEQAYPWELLGVNYDENTQTFWMYKENGVDKKELIQDKTKNDVYIIEDDTYFVINKQKNAFVCAIFDDVEIKKGASIDSEEVHFEMDGTSVTYRFNEKNITIKKKDGQMSFDLNDIEPEKLEQLKQELEAISPEVKEYFERAKVVPTYASMFK